MLHVVHEVDERDFRAPCVVQISETVAETRSQMKESACRLAGHPRVTVGRACSHTFAKPKHATHFREECGSFAFEA
jgi:hypothetical protein